jgi:diacylglycerol kinase (ATP)
MSDGAASVDVPVGGAVMKGRSGGLARIWYAAGYSAAGLKAAYRGEAAFRQRVLLNLR